MPTLRTLPYKDYAIGRRRYTADAKGLIEHVDPDDVGGLLAAGCTATDPWWSPPLRQLPEPEPERKPSVRMKSPSPFQNYAPASGIRYSSDLDGNFLAHEEHVIALVAAGCKRIREEPA